MHCIVQKRLKIVASGDYNMLNIKYYNRYPHKRISI